jgi:hypothetical protein
VVPLVAVDASVGAALDVAEAASVEPDVVAAASVEPDVVVEAAALSAGADTVVSAAPEVPLVAVEASVAAAVDVELVVAVASATVGVVSISLTGLSLREELRESLPLAERLNLRHRAEIASGKSRRAESV